LIGVTRGTYACGFAVGVLPGEPFGFGGMMRSIAGLMQEGLMQVVVSRMISAGVFTAIVAGAVTLGYVKGAAAQQPARSAQAQTPKLDFHEYDGTWELIGGDTRTPNTIPKVIRFKGGSQALAVSLEGPDPDVYRIDESEVRSIAQASGTALDRWTRLTILPDALALTIRTRGGDNYRLATNVLTLSDVLTVERVVSTADTTSGTINVPGDPRNVRTKATYRRTAN
jgi:hypothetical protein